MRRLRTRLAPWPAPWLALLLALLLSLSALPGLAAAQAGDEVRDEPAAVQVLRQATLDGPDGHSTVSLPHKLDGALLGSRGRTVVYHLALDLPAVPAAPLAVYVPKLSLAAELRVNGRPAGRCALAPLDEARCLHQPQLFVPPSDVWQAGTNTLELTLFANNRQPSGLSAVSVGDAIALGHEHAWRRLWTLYLMQFLSAALLAISLLSLAGTASAGVTQQERQTYTLFGISGLVNVACNLNQLIAVPPVGFELYSAFTYLIRLESMPLYVLTMLSLYGALRPWLWRALLGCIALLPVVLWASGNSPTAVLALHGVLGLSATLALAWCGRLAWHSQRPGRWVMVAAGVLMTVTGWSDLIRFQGAVAFERVYLLPYAYSLTLLVMGAMMLKWLEAALIAERAQTQTLEARIAERDAELRQAYAAMREAEQRRIRDEERTALALHMHDGLGSQLVSARAALTAGEIDRERAARILGDCSDDLRLVLNALHQPEVSLARCVADFRHRLNSRLADTALQVDWAVALQGLPPLQPAQTLQLLRILQEAVANVIRHAQARHMAIALHWADGVLTLQVSDDGLGFAVPAASDLPGPGSGMGLHNLRKRAAGLGATLHLDSGPQGTRVALHWHPLPAP